MLGGVAGGVAEFFGLDPLLVRVGFVLLAIFGSGIGVLLYLLGWLVVPTASDKAYVSRDRIGVAVLAMLAVALLLASLLFASPMFGPVDGPPALLALALIGAGVLLFRQDTRRAAAEAVSPAVPAAGPAVATAPPPPPPRPPRPRSILGRVTLALALVAVGLLALLANAGLVDAGANHYLGLAMTCIGAGLVAGAWRGRAYSLMLVGLVLLPPTLISNIAAAHDVSLGDGVGGRYYEIDSAADLDRRFEHGAGYLQLDMHQLELDQDAQVDVSLGVGGIEVVVPEDLRVAVRGSIQAGEATLFNDSTEYPRGDSSMFRLPPEGGEEGDPVLTLNLNIALGQVVVVRDGDMLGPMRGPPFGVAPVIGPHQPGTEL